MHPQRFASLIFIYERRLKGKGVKVPYCPAAVSRPYNGREQDSHLHLIVKQKGINSRSWEGVRVWAVSQKTCRKHLAWGCLLKECHRCAPRGLGVYGKSRTNVLILLAFNKLYGRLCQLT